jgi:hypothetical protein
MSDFKLLANTVGATVDTIAITGGSIPSGFDIDDIISGPRSTMFKTTGASNKTSPAYSDSTNSFQWTHCVVARADLMARASTSQGFAIEQDTGGGYGAVTGASISTLTTSDLIGVDPNDNGYGQDVVLTPTTSPQAGVDGIRLAITESGGTTNVQKQISKFYASNAFDFDNEPDSRPSPVFQRLAPTERAFRPLYGWITYDTEARITLTWRNLTQAKVENFKSIPELLNWPMFLYDPQAHIFEWKLEHVIIEGYSEQIRNPDAHDLSVTFRRLAHYNT